MNQSPYAKVGEELSVNGVSAVPIKPGTKFPGEYSNGRWSPMRGWSGFNTTPPTAEQVRLWSNWPGAGVGIVLGEASGNLMAVDIDNATEQMLDVIQAILPESDVRKVGKKGYTAFYQTDGTIRPQKVFAPLEEGGKPVAIIEFLGHGNQTVIPPTIHPETEEPYKWENANCDLCNTPPDELPFLTAEVVQAIGEALSPFNADVQTGSPRLPNTFNRKAQQDIGDGVGVDVYHACNTHALNKLELWVEDLGLYNGKWEGGAFRSVATWRGSGTGRATAVRKRNLSISRGGIKDFGTGETFSALDIVMRMQNNSLADAWGWLAERVDPLLQWDVTPLIEEWNRKAMERAGFREEPNAGDK